VISFSPIYQKKAQWPYEADLGPSCPPEFFLVHSFGVRGSWGYIRVEIVKGGHIGPSITERQRLFSRYFSEKVRWTPKIGGILRGAASAQI